MFFPPSDDREEGGEDDDERGDDRYSRPKEEVNTQQINREYVINF